MTKRISSNVHSVSFTRIIVMMKSSRPIDVCSRRKFSRLTINPYHAYRKFSSSPFFLPSPKKQREKNSLGITPPAPLLPPTLNKFIDRWGATRIQSSGIAKIRLDHGKGRVIFPLCPIQFRFHPRAPCIIIPYKRWKRSRRRSRMGNLVGRMRLRSAPRCRWNLKRPFPLAKPLPERSKRLIQVVSRIYRLSSPLIATISWISPEFLLLHFALWQIVKWTVVGKLTTNGIEEDGIRIGKDKKWDYFCNGVVREFV